MPIRSLHPSAVLRFAASLLALLQLTWLSPATPAAEAKPPAAKPAPIQLIVLDPLAKELACACVKGYAQRDYRKLSARFESSLKQRVSIEFSDDLSESLAGRLPGQELIVIIGERALVIQGAAKAGLACHPLGALTGPDGTTTFTGSFVARSQDTVRRLQEIGGRSLLFGLADTDVNRAMVKSALAGAGSDATVTLQKAATYSDAALDVLDSKTSPPPVAIIPTYALPLLEGCGSIKPGELRVFGMTPPTPFITLFVSDNWPVDQEKKLLKTILRVGADPKLLRALESREGFKSLTALAPAEAHGADPRSAQDWPDFRGPRRDGHVPRLPVRLPAKARLCWNKAAMSGGLAGLSVSGGRLLLAERDFGEEHDVYRCLNAKTGDQLWRAEFPARGRLDYGQAPRATPVIRGGKAYLLGAFGELRCVDVITGKPIWKRQLPQEFHGPLPTWGMSSTPLLIDDLIIVNPGGPEAAVAALDAATGRTRWTSPGSPAAYSSFICGEFGGRRQIVGYDHRSLGGWDTKTGERLWQLVPANQGDFNVPTPIAIDGGIVLATENNGTRLYRFDGSGRALPQPAGRHADLAPDTVTPVATCGRIFGMHQGLRCISAEDGLKPIWQCEDASLGDHASFIADDERVLVITLGGRLILLDGRSDQCSILSRLQVFDEDVEVYSHPALVGTRLYIRGGSRVVCVDLEGHAAIP